ncbi:hypothetical protein ESCOCK386M_11575 [Escherichia coli]
MFLFLVMVTEAIWLLLQCDKLWYGWLVAKNLTIEACRKKRVQLQLIKWGVRSPKQDLLYK